MKCGAKTRSGTPCGKSPLIGKRRCMLHGGGSLSGASHWNYQHGKCTKAAREHNREVRSEIQLIYEIGNHFGLFTEMPRIRR